MRAGSFSVRLIAGMNKADRFAPSVPWILFLMGIVFFIMIPRLLLAPLLLRISADLGISYSQASYFFLTSSAGFIAGLFSSGYVAQRLGHKWTIVSSLAAAGLFLVLLSRVRDIGFFHLFLFLDGWAIGLYPGSGITAVSAMAPTIHRGKALAIHECGPNLAFILAPVSAAALAPSIGWRGVMLTFGLCGMALSGLFALYGRAGSGRGQPPNFRNIAELARNRSFWVIAALFSMATIGAMGVYGVLPTYLIAVQRFPERYVNNLIGLSRITAFIAILTAGSLTDRYGFRPVVTVILVTTGLATLILGLAHGRLLVLGVLLQPMIIGAFFPVSLNALAEVTAPERRNLAVALVLPIANLLGAGLAPPVLAAAGDRGWFPQAFIIVGIMLIFSVALLPLMGKPWPVVSDLQTIEP
jgi:NNP family nitrate/nitrite transporter-like MFS transporter